MKKMYGWVLTLALAFSCLSVQAQAPTEASIKQLLKVANVQLMLTAAQDELSKQLDDQAQASLSSLNAKQQVIAKKMYAELDDRLQLFLSWKKIEPIMVGLYQQLYTQEEVNALSQFYASPVGSSIAKKMPEMMNLTQKLMQEQMAALVPEIMAIEQKYAQELRDAK